MKVARTHKFSGEYALIAHVPRPRQPPGCICYSAKMSGKALKRYQILKDLNVFVITHHLMPKNLLFLLNGFLL